MYGLFADAHTHIPPCSGELACVSACFPCDWQKLAGFCDLPIKKSYGIHPKAFDSCASAGEPEVKAAVMELDSYLAGADAVGEIGLDKKARLSPELQKALFEWQLDLASERKLPVVVHSSGRPGETYDILKRWRMGGAGERNRRFLLHAAKFSAELARSFQLLGAYFSFGLRELKLESGAACAAAVSDDSLMVESDSTSRAGSLAEAINVLAEIRAVGAECVARITHRNFLRFYGRENSGNLALNGCE